ncbi:hypothetical protein G7Y89_g440 [Cudoniella acicularis]|uniref:2,5-diamino-6-ribosylamino-4(3H)-pyrimidinone 5'-phosphate reductase n=1 Tax=Cudoniella acicularis TaxID=354080 RepID=A0A8H4RX60_9HELO|nr:hypothetical protein G7Y89_g440 [Cudoniella acicularis]
MGSLPPPGPPGPPPPATHYLAHEVHCRQHPRPRDIEPQWPATLSRERQIELEPYLPPPRATFLQEGEPDLDKEPWTTYRAHLNALDPEDRLPHVTLTYAQSLDSQISLSPGIRTTLSGPDTKGLTHYLRSRHDAILIGIGTARADDPGLNCRFGYNSFNGLQLVDFAHQPKPIILDPSKTWRDDLNKRLFDVAKAGLGRGPIWLISSTPLFLEPKDELEQEEDNIRIDRCRDVGGYRVVAGEYSRTQDGVEWEAILTALAEHGIRSVMIEGGATVINDLLRERNQKFINSLIVTIAPTYLGTGGVVVSPFRSVTERNEAILEDVKWLPYGKDVVMAYRRKRQNLVNGNGSSYGEVVLNGINGYHDGSSDQSDDQSTGIALPPGLNGVSNGGTNGIGLTNGNGMNGLPNGTLLLSPPVSEIENTLLALRTPSPHISETIINPDTSPDMKAYNILMWARGCLDKAKEAVSQAFVPERDGRDGDNLQSTFIRSDTNMKSYIAISSDFPEEQGVSQVVAEQAIYSATIPIDMRLRDHVEVLVDAVPKAAKNPMRDLLPSRRRPDPLPGSEENSSQRLSTNPWDNPVPRVEPHRNAKRIVARTDTNPWGGSSSNSALAKDPRSTTDPSQWPSLPKATPKPKLITNRRPGSTATNPWGTVQTSSPNFKPDTNRRPGLSEANSQPSFSNSSPSPKPVKGPRSRAMETNPWGNDPNSSPLPKLVTGRRLDSGRPSTYGNPESTMEVIQGQFEFTTPSKEEKGDVKGGSTPGFSSKSATNCRTGTLSMETQGTPISAPELIRRQRELNRRLNEEKSSENAGLTSGAGPT